jgi:DNA-binding MarR family transcriptional regulator
MLKKMEEEGVIKRVRDKNDKRITRIVLTKKGKNKREQSRLAVFRFNEVLYDKLSVNEKKCFFQVMNKINGILDENKIF